jgi:hypothetical protein
MMIHELDIAKWPNATFVKWSALFDKTPSLEWNHKALHPAKVSTHNSKLFASLASVNADKASP